MNKKVVVLVDGQNLFYALQQMGLKERDINWASLFASFCEPTDELIRAYWFRPQKIQDSHLTAESIRNQVVYKKYNNYYANYRNGKLSIIDAGILASIEQDAKDVERWLHEQKARFSNIEYNYDQLYLDNADIE